LAIAAWVGNESFDVQLAEVAPSAAQGTPVGGNLGTLIRAHYFMDLGNFDTMIGAGIVTGNAKTYANAAVAAVGAAAAVAVNQNTANFAMDLKFIDFQMQGDLTDDMSLGVYADYATVSDKAALATATSAAVTNFYGGNAGKFTGYSLRAELKPVHNIGVGAGFASNKTTAAAAAAIKTDTVQAAAFYEVYQNLEINLIYNSAKAAGVTTNTATLEFEALL